MTTFTSATSFINVPDNDHDEGSSNDRNRDNNNQLRTAAPVAITPAYATESSLLFKSFTNNGNNNVEQNHQQFGCDYNNDRGGLILFVIHVLVVLAISIYYISSMTRLRSDEIFLQQYDELQVNNYWDNMIPYYEPWYLIVILLVPCLIIVSMTYLLDSRTCKSFLKATTILDTILFLGTFLSSIITLQFQHMIIWYIQGRTVYCPWDRIPFLSTMIDISTSIIQSQKVEVLAFYAYIYLLLFYLWLYLLWKTLVAAYFVRNSNPDDIDNILPSIFIFFFISSYWMFRVLRNVTHVTTASIVGSLCLSPGSSPLSTTATGVSLSKKTHALHLRSVDKLFGTICTGFLTDVIEFVKVGCCCRENDIIFSHWVFLFVAIDGSNYKDSEKNARTLFQTNTWNLFRMDYLYKVDLSMIGTIIGYVALFYIVIAKFVLDPPTSDDYMVVVAVVPLIFGYTMTMTVFTIIETIARTVIICYYRSPHEFQTNYPQHYERMTEILPRRGAMPSIITATDSTGNEGLELS